MHLKKIATLSIPLLLMACATSTPQYRTEASLEQGELIEGCRNVSDTARVNEYSTITYDTTWDSAMMEGAAAGIDDGLSGQNRAWTAVRDSLSESMMDGDDEVRQDGIFRERVFCRAYSANRREVAAIVSDILQELPHNLSKNDIDAGLFVTDFHDWENSFMGSVTRWKDAFVVTVEEERLNRVIVRVKRGVYISRMSSPFHQAKSSGKKEIWVLTQILNEFNPSYN